MNLREELEKLVEKYPDPREGALGELEFEMREDWAMARPALGVVCDVHDPACLGRIRVQCDAIAPGAVTPWIPIAGVWRGKRSGWRMLPEPGTQALLFFVGGSRENAVVHGFIYDENHRPPKISAENPSKSIVWQCKNQRLEMIDEDGKESFTVSAAEGKMRLVMSRDGVLELVNELGDIRIKCRKLTVIAETARIEADKELSVKSEGDMKVKAEKGITVECGGAVKISGRRVNLEGSKGVTAEGKQAAGREDAALGFDIHKTVVPSGSGTAVVLLPHPYIGRLTENLSPDVFLSGGRQAAVQGSKSQHSDARHLQLPGTVKFEREPDKKGEITGGCAESVRINGKPAAVIGSKVTSCNDIGARDTSVVMAAGSSMPMPSIADPMRGGEYADEREAGRARRPEITAARWSAGVAREDESAELSAETRDIADGNGVTFQVWREGQDPAAGGAYAVIQSKTAGGHAAGAWAYSRLGRDESAPAEDPRFFFTAHCAWCPPKQSGMFTVKLKRPELSDPQWRDKNGKQTDKGLVGERLGMSVRCNGDVAEGSGVLFKVYEAEADPSRGEPFAECSAVNQGGQAECEWDFSRFFSKRTIDKGLYNYYQDKGIDIPLEKFDHFLDDYENPIESDIKKKPKYFFTVCVFHCKDVVSGTVEITKTLKVTLKNELGEGESRAEVTVKQSDGTEKKGKTNGEGVIEFADLIPAENFVMIKRNTNNDV